MSTADWARVSCTSRALSRVCASLLYMFKGKTSITTKEVVLQVCRDAPWLAPINDTTSRSHMLGSVTEPSCLCWGCQVQLETLSLAPRSAAGISWATAHWRDAKVVALTICGWDQQEMDQLSEVLDFKAACRASRTCRATTMRRVRHIALHLEAGSSSYPSFHLPGILNPRCTPRLESLCLVSDRMVWLGVNPTLKHLQLEVKHQSLFPLMRNLGIFFRKLETLTICSDIDVRHWGYSYYGTYWDFDFSELESLRCVNLQMVLPQGLKVPPGCQVHFVCHHISGASQVWDGGLGAACTSCHLVELLPFQQFAGQPSLPECLQRIVGFSCPHLTVLALDCSAVGSQEEPLVIGTSLPALRELEIRAAGDLHVWVGVSVSLESLILYSRGMLHFEMEDLDRLLSGLKVFEYAYKRCCMVTHMLLWNLSHIRKGTFNHDVATSVYIDGLTEYRTGWAPERRYVAVETGMCRYHICGTCMLDCLRRKHLPVSDNVEWPFVGLFEQPL